MGEIASTWRFSPDLPRVWDGVLSSDKERGAFAWGMREAWLHSQAMRPPLVLTDIPEGSGTECISGDYRRTVTLPRGVLFC